MIKSFKELRETKSKKKQEAKITDYMSEEKFKELLNNREAMSTQNLLAVKIMPDMEVRLKWDQLGYVNYKITKNDDGNYELTPVHPKTNNKLELPVILLTEGKVVELPNEQEVLEVSTEPADLKIEKEDKSSFEEFKVLYKGQIDDKCLEDYGTIEDEKLWEDAAKELFMASEDYMPEEKDKAKKIEESKLEEAPRLNKELIAKMEDPNNFKDLYYFSTHIDDIEKVIDNCEDKAKCKKYKEILKAARAFASGRTKTESASDRYQVREFEGPGAKFGVFDTKEDKFVQKGSKYVMVAACDDLNKTGKVTESSIIKNTLKEMLSKKEEKIESGNSIFELKFDCSNEDVFGIGYELENSLSDVLYKVADKVKSGMLDSSILDINGNKIGSYGLGYEGVQSGLTEATDADIEAAKKDSKEKGLYCEDKNDSVYYTYSIYTMNDKNDTWTWKDSFESEGIADKKEAEEKAKAKVKELKDSGEFYDVSYKEWENDREEEKKYDIDISKYDTVDKIKARIKEINNELAYCRRRDKVCATFGGDQQVYDLNVERDKLRAELNKLKKTKTESKVTDYIEEEELDQLIKNNKVLGDVTKNYEAIEDMILDVTTDMGHSYYKVIKNDDGSYEAYLINKSGEKLGDAFLLKEAVEEEIAVTDGENLVNSVMVIYISNQTFMKYYNLEKPLTIDELKNIRLKIKNHEMYVTDIADKLNATEVKAKKELVPNTYIMKIKENDVEDLEEVKEVPEHTDKYDAADYYWEEQDIKAIKELLGDAAEVKIENDKNVLQISAPQTKYINGGIINGSDELVNAINDIVHKQHPDVKVVCMNHGTTFILRDTVTWKSKENKEEANINSAVNTILQDFKDLDKLSESQVSDYTFKELNKVVNDKGNDFKIQISGSEDKTNWLNIDKEDLQAIYQALQNRKAQ